MENDAPQSPLPEQGRAEQQEYYGWQYDQDDATEVIQPRNGAAPYSRVSSQPLPNTYNPPPLPSSSPTLPEGPEARNDALYPDPLYDLGSSLGYGQGMESRYFDAPQPSQPIEMVRQERLQQLREERMRRQQRRMPADLTGLLCVGRKRVCLLRVMHIHNRQCRYRQRLRRRPNRLFLRRRSLQGSSRLQSLRKILA